MEAGEFLKHHRSEVRAPMGKKAKISGPKTRLNTLIKRVT